MTDLIHEKYRHEFFPKTESWMLRNLATMEYVKGEGLSKAFPPQSHTKQGGLHLKHPGFGEALMCRTIWFDYYRRSLPNSQQGLWAGHRFDICTEKHRSSQSKGIWKNVTNELVAELSDDMFTPFWDMSG